MTDKVCYWDDKAGEQRERGMTPGEIVQRAIDITVDNKPDVSAYTAAIQAMLDTKMAERRYFGILSACSYATSTNPVFQAEALACVAWRDDVWATAYQVLDDVETGKRAQPTIEQLLELLPKLTWPA